MPHTGPAPPDDPFAGWQGRGARIKVSRHCSFHGLALNVNVDLAPFQRIRTRGVRGWKPPPR